jgi:hypothetical protein
MQEVSQYPTSKYTYRALAIKQHGSITKTDMKTSRTDDLGMNLHIYAHMILTKVPKTYNGIKTGFSTNIVGKLDICMLKTES